MAFSSDLYELFNKDRIIRVKNVHNFTNVNKAEGETTESIETVVFFILVHQTAYFDCNTLGNLTFSRFPKTIQKEAC